MYSDEQLSRVYGTVPCRWSTDIKKVIEESKRTGYPCLLYFGESYCGNCLHFQSAVSGDAFITMIRSYGKIYLGSSHDFDEVFNIRAPIFRTVTGSSYTGYPKYDGKKYYITAPSIVLLTYDKGTTMWFHIYGGYGSYDITSNYICCPYHDTIQSISASYTSDNVANFIQQYLNLITPKGSGDEAIEESVEKAVEMQKDITIVQPEETKEKYKELTNYISHVRSAIISRFNITLEDILKYSDFDKSSYAEKIHDVHCIGSWFIDHDKTLRSKTYEQNTISTDGELVTFRVNEDSVLHIKKSSGSGTFHVVKNPSNIIERISYINIFESGTKQTVDDIIKTIDIESNRISYQIPDSHELSIALTTNDIVIISSKNIRLTTFDISR